MSRRTIIIKKRRADHEAREKARAEAAGKAADKPAKGKAAK